MNLQEAKAELMQNPEFRYFYYHEPVTGVSDDSVTITKHFCFCHPTPIEE